MHRLLNEAIERNRVATVARLLAENPQWAKQADGTGHTALFLALSTERRSAACVRVLIEAGADVKANVSGGFSVLHWVVGDWSAEFARKDTKKIIALLVEAGAELEATNQYGFTPLMSAVIDSNFAGVEGLLEVGANPNAIVPAEGYTAFNQGQSVLSLTWFVPDAGSMMKILLEAGADNNLRDACGRTALEYWEEMGKFPIEDDEYRQFNEAKAAECLALLRQ